MSGSPRQVTRWGMFKAALGLGAVTYFEGHSVGSDDGWRIVGGRTKSPAGLYVSEFTALNLPTVYACMNRISNPLAGVPLRLFRRNAKGGSDPVTDHPLSNFGMRANEFMSSRTFRKTVQTHSLLWGNGYAEIQRDESGRAIGFWPIPPDTCWPSWENNALVYRVALNGKSIILDSVDVIHLMDVSTNGYLGTSPIQRAAAAVGLAQAAETFGSKFFANDAKSGGFLMHPATLSPAARQNIAESITQEGGIKNAHRVKILEEGMKYVDTQVPPEAAQFLGTRLFQVAELARIYDVPLILLQSTENTTAWGSGIEQLMIGFVRQTIKPWVDAWEQELNHKCFTDAERAEGLYLKFNLNGLLRGDSQQRSHFYSTLFNLAAISPNEIRALEDMESIGADGDEYFAPANVRPLSQALQPPAPPPAMNGGPGGTPNPTQPQPGRGNTK